jgi:hypothetical protein
MISWPPLLTTVDDATPALRTKTTPPLETVTSCSVRLAPLFSVTPLNTLSAPSTPAVRVSPAPIAAPETSSAPPLDTTAEPPALTTRPSAIPPL